MNRVSSHDSDVSEPKSRSMTEPERALRSILVTGAASPRGIGRATVRRLLLDGWNVALIDRDSAALTKFSRELEASTDPGRVAAATADISKSAVVREAVEFLASKLPPFFGVVNLAGISSSTRYLGIGETEWRRVLDINLSGAHYVTQAALPLLIKGGCGGRIVSISSVSAQRGGGTFSHTAYSTAKAGIIGFTRALAREVGAHGITVNAIAPGPIDTDIMGGALSEVQKIAMIAEQFIPRIGSVDDVAGVISFLLGPDAAFVTGQTVNVNGGLYL